jgi:DNA-binding HxlR family transcriptional regulator/putative sterol carrier protein
MIVRDLLLGPKRYKDLLAGLPGIGTNLLADRLREMTTLGIAEQVVLPPPAGSTVYRLTETGMALEPVLMAIARWGARFMGERREDDWLSPSAYFLAMRAVFNPAKAKRDECFEVRVGEKVFEVRVAGGRCTTREGQPPAPDVVIALDVEALNALLVEDLPPALALTRGLVTVKGDLDALERFVGMFRIHFPSPAVASLTRPLPDCQA